MLSETTYLQPDAIGEKASTISVELSTRFLEHFSEQLYSSPQKAFEELISNGWDAGADLVDIRIATNLRDPRATMSVLDNGHSMDAEGLRQLWHIAFSPKTDKPTQYGRRVIGKFGIGKLATYVLAQKVTYICKAADGKIRRVTMDYSVVDQQAGTDQDKLIRDLELDLFEVTEEEVAEALRSVSEGSTILDLINERLPRPERTELESEFGDFGGSSTPIQSAPKGTWTLVVLSELKPTAHELKVGVLRRMLEAALPIGSEMAITLNGQLLESSKIDKDVMDSWEVGPSLGIDYVEIDNGSSDGEENADEASEMDDFENPRATKATRVSVEAFQEPYPHVKIEGLGEVTGRVWLFEDRITGGISDARGASNGFHVNVLGRVVNQSDPSFGEKNLNHAAWAKFRANVRCDALNLLLTTDREKFKDRRELRLFRSYLRRLFNKARTVYDDDDNAVMPHSGDILVDSLGVLSLSPLRSVVSDALLTQPPIPGLFDDSGIEDRTMMRQSWRENTAENIKNAVSQVKFEKSDGENLVQFRILDNTIVVNSNHPFVAENGRTKAAKELIRTVALVNLLSDVYALELGVPPSTLMSIRDYRDRLMRYRALQSRRSGVYIAKLLLQTQHESDQSRKLEKVVSDALRYLGFQVQDLGKPGEPEGIASAFATPTNSTPTTANPHPPLYSFSFDAKSSKHTVAATGNIKLSTRR